MMAIMTGVRWNLSVVLREMFSEEYKTCFDPWMGRSKEERKMNG
jgi:hypothetical protein